MKQIMLFLSVVFMTVQVGFGQKSGDRFQKIKEQKVEFLSKKMELSDDVAKEFWTNYDEYKNALRALNRVSGKRSGEMTDEEAQKILTGNLDRQTKEVQLKKDFYEKSEKLISYKQLYQMERGEEEFNRQLFERYKKSQGRSSSHAAKPSKGQFEKVKAQKVAFLTEKMNLTVDESKAFWPVYNGYEEDMRELKRQGWNKKEEMDDTKAKEVLFSGIDRQNKEIQLKKDFYTKASEVVPYKKLLLMERGEREFRQKLFEGYKKNHSKGRK